MRTRFNQYFEKKQMLPNDTNFPKIVMTDDEIWIDHFDPFT